VVVLLLLMLACLIGRDKMEAEAQRQQQKHQRTSSDMQISLHEEATSSEQADAVQSSKDDGMTFNRPAAARQHGSLDSTTSSSGTNAHSQRSSFAMERASLDANRSSLEMFGNLPQQQTVPAEAGNQNIEAMGRQMGLPKEMVDR
jgi:hypothetical protein